MAFPDDWSHKWPININADSVISSPVADWPCLVTNAHFPAEAWALMNADGSDLRFSSDEDGASELYYDDPRLDVAGESAHLYVGVPSLASGADTTIYAWVGNAEVTAPSAAWKQNTWPLSLIECVYPMQEGSGLTLYDRSANGYTCTLVSEDAWQSDGSGGYYLDTTQGRFTPDQKPADYNELHWFARCKSEAGAGRIRSIYVANMHFYFRDGDVVESRSYSLDPQRLNVENIDIVSSVRTWGLTWDGITRSLYIDGVQEAGPQTPAGSVDDARLESLGYGIDHYENLWEFVRAPSADEAALHHLMLSDPTWAEAGELEAVGGPSRPLLKTETFGLRAMRGETL